VSSLPDALDDRLAGLMISDRHRLARRLRRACAQHGEGSDRELASVAAAIEHAEARRAARAASVPSVTYPSELPVASRHDEILAAIRDNQVVILSGETGSGKTTQLPKMCLELGRGIDGMIGHTQPRRIAARTVAERLADELAVPIGGAVGYQVRFADSVGEETLVKVMTDGILLAEIRRDRLLSAYDTVIVDEAHERSLNIDFLLGYLTQLLPRRRDLKVIVTSATIDTARFAEHFAAPVVEVSGRTYPVEVRYRPLRDEPAEPAGPAARAGAAPTAPGRSPAEPWRRPGRGEEPDPAERDPNQAICDAVAELVASGPGDILVFLPGERDIRDAADALRASGPGELEILPLYARLTAAEQHRVFQLHRGRRVVLATNVAETSLTVPGIRFVVDTGLARVSRYSHRTKVQRLPIEAVSQASADQRAGRCGRVAAGVCVRLYSEEDYRARPQFTDPEILRTNLASVILQMAAIGLGEVERFPFIQPPDRRSVADGRALLEELGAFQRRNGTLGLTPIGRRLADLPLDPRLGRMVLEAEQRGCLREVTIIAAALSIQDPRERPAEQAQAAGELHARFVVPDSDFLGLVRLWDYLAGLQRELSGNQFRKRCRAELLNVLRIREWQDVAGQIRQVYRSAGVHGNVEPAPPEQVHQAVLAGLLSQIGMRDRVRGDYQGARNTRWQISRASSLARRQPPWAMAGELVETERTWARTVARIEPGWAERLGAHLVKRSYSEPWWEPERGEAITDERVTLYGLPVVAGRRTSLARTDPAAARRLFIQRALVERDWPPEPPPLERNRARLEQVVALEERARRHLLVAGDEALFAFYDARLPAEVTSGRRFEQWWRRAREEDPRVLDVPLRSLIDPDAGPIEASDYPDVWRTGEVHEEGLELALRYRWEPGAADDGVTVEIPLAVLNRVPDDGFDWQVPGLREELVVALIRSLPKAVRRLFVPAADVARAVLAATGPADGPLLEAVARRLSLLGGAPVSAEMFDLDGVPPHLQMRFEVLDGGHAVIGQGGALHRLRAALRAEMRAALAAAAPELVRHGAPRWDFGDLPRHVERGAARGYPALVDEGDAVGVAVLESPEAQREAMWRGTRRLLQLAAPLPATHLQRRLTNEAKLALARSKLGVDQLLEDCSAAVADQIIAAHGGPAFDAAVFEAIAVEARSGLVDRVARVATLAGAVIAAAEHVEEGAARLERRDRAGLLGAALADVRHQLAGLVHPGFVSEAGTGRFRDLLRYLEAARRRLEHLPADARRDTERQQVVTRVQARYERFAGGPGSGSGAPSAPSRRDGSGRAEVRWMIEELRVSLWAQELGTAGPVSEERIMRVLDRMGA
jgi:ATP-dependent helicase HrpA